MQRNFLLVAVLCLAATLPILTHAADDKAADADAKSAATKQVNRLPAHFGKLVDKAQREKIYTIQSKYAEKIEDLQEQLKEVMLQRDAEIREVLTEEQRKKLDELLSATRSKMKAVKKTTDEKGATAKADESAKK